MNYRILKEYFKRLQKGSLRSLVAIVATIHQTLKYRSLIYIYIDKEGDWYNCRRDVIFVSPELNVSSYKNILANVLDFWCYDYRLKAGDTVIDVGAGIGDDVVAFSRLVGVNGRVVAIEAHPGIYRCLVKTIKANRLTNVTALNVAALDRDAEVSISDEENILSNNIMGGVGAIIVPGCSLDHLLQKIDIASTDLIKMNIEGAETVALRGMENTLCGALHVVVSCHDFIANNHGGSSSLRTLNDVTRIIQDAGYSISRRSDDLREEVKDYVYGRKISN
jgi:FkbM family methyltransferase